VVSKFVSAIHKKYTSVTEAALVISIFTFLAQLLGVLRDRLFSHYLGPSANLDIYLTAFRVPDFLYIIFSTLISATILIPILSKNDENKYNTVNSIFSVFLFLILFLSLLFFIFMPFIARFIAPGFGPENTEKLIFLSRLMLVSPILLGVSNFIGSVNQYNKKFFSYAISPVLYNLGIIFGIIFFYNSLGLFGLGLGVILGGVFHLITQAISYFSSDYSLKVIKVKDISLVKDILKISIPRTITLSITNLTIIILISLVSFSNPGSISLMTFALSIAFVPFSLVGTPFTTASFPYIISLIKNKDESVNSVIENTLEKIIFWTIALVFLFIIFRFYIVRVILGTNLFSWSDTLITSALVFVFSISVVFQSINQFFIRIYYANNNTKKPLLISFLGFITNLVLLLSVFLFIKNVNIMFFDKVFHLNDIHDIKIILIAFTYSLSALATSFLFVYFYVKDFKHNIYNFIFKNMFMSISHSIVLVLLSKFFLFLFKDIASSKTLLGILIQTSFAGISAIIIWFIYLLLIKNNHTYFITDKIKSIFSSNKFILEETQDM
jgi:putative peptidoglycan lipid II flippase